jgi:hypothetical protein
MDFGVDRICVFTSRHWLDHTTALFSSAHLGRNLGNGTRRKEQDTNLGSSGRLGHSLGLERIRNGNGREISTSSSYHIMARQKSAFWLDFEAWDVWSQGCVRVVTRYGVGV